jgi:hypothetical protein
LIRTTSAAWSFQALSTWCGKCSTVAFYLLPCLPNDSIVTETAKQLCELIALPSVTPACLHTGVDFLGAAVLVEGGIPSVAFGPGNVAWAREREEWIWLKSLEQAKDLLVHLLSSLP